MRARAYRVEFPDSGHAPVELPELANLSEWLTAEDSPLLFGCRTGLCGTCLVEVETLGDGRLKPPDGDEAETLAIYAPGNAKARLACQIALTASLRVWKIDGG